MRGAELNAHLDRLRAESSKLNHEMIAAGRGNERPSEYLSKPDELSQRLQQNSAARQEAQNEIERRVGPGATSVPRGYKFR